MRICSVFISKPKFEAGHPYVDLITRNTKGTFWKGSERSLKI